MLKKNKYEKDRSDFEDKINKVDKKTPDVRSLVKKKTDFNTKVTEIEDKIPAFSSLVKKTPDYVTQITSIRNDCVTNAALDARHKDLVQKQHLSLNLKKLMIKLVKIVQKCCHMNTN